MKRKKGEKKVRNIKEWNEWNVNEGMNGRVTSLMSKITGRTMAKLYTPSAGPNKKAKLVVLARTKALHIIAAYAVNKICIKIE